MNELKFGEDTGLGQPVLLCPVCGNDYLHHCGIESFERQEDEKTGLHVVIKGEDVGIKHDTLKGNPSSRRDGLKIRFFCEGCGEDELVLVIFQHKGSTYIGWDKS